MTFACCWRNGYLKDIQTSGERGISAVNHYLLKLKSAAFIFKGGSVLLAPSFSFISRHLNTCHSSGWPGIYHEASVKSPYLVRQWSSLSFATFGFTVLFCLPFLHCCWFSWYCDFLFCGHWLHNSPLPHYIPAGDGKCRKDISNIIKNSISSQRLSREHFWLLAQRKLKLLTKKLKNWSINVFLKDTSWL